MSIFRLQRTKLLILLIVGLSLLSIYMFTHVRVNDGEDLGLPLPVKSRSSAEKKDAFVEFTGKTWMSFTDVDSPGVYRACVPRPHPETKLKSTVTGGIVENTKQMTIIHCLNKCIKLRYTYAALGKGTQCLCSDIRGKENALLDYKDSKFCDVPCSGEALYNCGGKQYLSLYRTKVPDARCSSIELKPKGSLPLLALASYPRSGNTWTRQLIEKASGIYTGSTLWEHEKKMKISQKVFLGGNMDYKLRQTICVKAHAHTLKNIKEFTGAIVLIRNPYRTLVAEVFRRQMIERNESLSTILKYFQSKDWDEFVRNQIETWKTTALNWINNSPKVLVVHYEDLEDNTFKGIKEMMNFLKVHTTDKRIRCAIDEHPSSKSTGLALGNHFRKTRAYLTENPFSDTQKALIDKNIKTLNATLITKKLKSLPSDYSVTVF